MMYPRLLLAQSLLREDGVIFISIDDHEVANLRKMCDEVFGEGNFVAQLVWSAGRKNDSKHVSLSHEYVVCYFRNSLQIKERSIVWREKKEGLADIYEKYEQLKKEFKEDIEAIELGMKRWFKSLQDGNPAKNHRHYSRVDSRGLFFADNISWPGGGGPKYEVLHPVTGKPVKVPSRGWITDQKTMMQWIAEDRVFFGPDENRVPTIKAYLTDRESSVPYSVLYKDGRAASKRLATLMGDKVFENPKDEQVIQRLLEWNQLSEGDIVLDFFSGSASVAHACMLSNVAREDMGIRFVMVQIQEPITTKGKTGSQLKVAENALKLCNTLGVSATICEIGKERIRRAGAKLREEYPEAEVDTGFRVL
ncbi:MAG: site-specific DNA-methyltransferase, partial [Spirochaetales bacterium]